jgi:methyl-accepting chemotaxis protein
MKLTLKTKLIIFTLVILAIPSFVIGFAGYDVARNELDNSGKVMLKNTVHSVIQTIDALDSQVKAGSLSLEDAQEKLRTYLLGPRTVKV